MCVWDGWGKVCVGVGVLSTEDSWSYQPRNNSLHVTASGTTIRQGERGLL